MKLALKILARERHEKTDKGLGWIRVLDLKESRAASNHPDVKVSFTHKHPWSTLLEPSLGAELSV